MMRIAYISSSAALLTGALLLLVGCDQDKRFQNAPEVTASNSPEAVTPANAGAGTDPASGQVQRAPKLDNIPKSGQLPADHPPVGAGVNPTDKAPRPRVASTGGKVNTYGSTGPLLWKAPDAWDGVKPSSSMRLAEYHAPGPDGSEPAVMSIFFFGPGGGGGVDANIDRWVGQFSQPDGTSSAKAAKRTLREVNGMKVHLIDVSGTYSAGAAMVQGSAGSKENQRVLGAIVEAPAGLFFFKLLGPKETMTAQEANFNAFVESFRPGN